MDDERVLAVLGLLALIGMLGAWVHTASPGTPQPVAPAAAGPPQGPLPDRIVTDNSTEAIATFAGGCFWCIEGAFMYVDGVRTTVSGYAGGKAATATYAQILTGETGHREAVRVTYDPRNVTYTELLDVFWRSIDPTDPGGQFADRGPQYTTAIYVHSQRQRRLAERSKQQLADSGRFDEPIVTEIENHTTFFRAEDRHQNYSIRNRARYEAYERASGREGFLQRVWESSPLG